MEISKKDWSGYLFVAPAVLLFLVFAIKPMIEAIILSFYQVTLREQTFIGLENYVTLFQDKIFWKEIKNTLTFVGIIVPANFGLALFIALVLNRFGHRFRSILRGCFYLPAVSSGVVMSIVFLWIFNQTYGPVNYLLSLVGIEPILWLSQPVWAKLAISAVVLNWIIGLNVILFLSALAGIPKQIHESAKIDGAGSLQRFFKITIPLIAPTSVYVLVMTTIGIFQIWAAIYLLTCGGPAYATTSIVYRIYRVGFVYGKFGLASARAVVLFLMIFSTAFLQFRYLNKRIEY